MPPATKKRPPMEMEPGEGKAHEMKESPEQEVREGSEAQEGEYGKNAKKGKTKRTKATKDGEGCGCGPKAKGKCDGSCGKKMDALTPQEYLTACELGIQGRARSYIRARLDSAQRLDLKCGNGSISEGEKCTKGTAQKVDPDARKRSAGRRSGGKNVRGLKTAAKIAGVAALIGGAAYMQQTARRNIMERRSLANPLSAAGIAFKAQTLRENMSEKAVRSLRERATVNAVARRRAKRDSVWAEGFVATPTTLRIDLKCGRGAISEGEKCTKGAAQKVEPKKASKASKTVRTKLGRGLARAAGGLAMTAGVGMMGKAVFTGGGGDPIRKAARGLALMNAGAGLNQIGEGRTRSGLRTIGASALGIAASEGKQVGETLINNYRQKRLNKRRQNLERAYRGPSAKRDSIYADGFSPELDQLAI